MLGERIGPYEVTGSLGRGGMGEVYRAHDERLGRDVALKILPTEFASDPERLARFRREARLLAALQHQNIAAIYGLEEHDGQPVLVMELVEGEDLSVRLGGPVPTDEVEKIARQLAAGLEYAHEQGIVHRDLKPGNVKLKPGGQVKILDFGLARAFEGPGGSSKGLVSDETVTHTRDLTGAGAVIGTAAYMSPEQSRGYQVDRRADIWAFGVIVFEMLSGERLFAGETASDTLAAVLRKDPDWSLVPADASPSLVQLCRRCLEKDPQLRLRDIGEARIALEGASSTMVNVRAPALEAPPAPSAVGGTSRIVAVAGVAAAVLLGFLGFTGRIGPEAPAAPMMRSTVVLDAGQGLNLNPASPGPPVISPDGRRLAFTAQDSASGLVLCVRDLDSDTVRRIPGTTGAVYPFWAPDSRRVGFFAGGDLQTVDVGGGPVVAICAADNAKGGSWSVNDEILFTPSHAAAIFKVDAAGGEPVAVTDPAADEEFRSHRFPSWLPDGRHFVYLAWFQSGGGGNRPETVLRVAGTDGGPGRDLTPCQTGARYAAGHLVYVHENNLTARPFDPGALAFTGPPRPIVGGVLALGAAHCGAFAVSDAGMLCYVRAGELVGDARLMWIDGEDRVPAVDRTRSLLGLDLSPDGSRIVVSMIDERQGAFDIWIHDLARDLPTRLTFAASSEMDPRWSPDGRWIAYTSDEVGTNVIYRKPADGGGAPEIVAQSDASLFVDSFAPDSRTLSVTALADDGGLSLWLLDLETGELRPFRDAPYDMSRSSFSPDGRWLAYSSNETGQPEVFVESVAQGGGRWRISANGGQQPLWAPGGDAVYYLDDTGTLRATEIVSTQSGLAIGRTRALTTGVVAELMRAYAVDRATGRILVQVPAQGNQVDRIEIITNWQRLLAAGEG